MPPLIVPHKGTISGGDALQSRDIVDAIHSRQNRSSAASLPTLARCLAINMRDKFVAVTRRSAATPSRLCLLDAQIANAIRSRRIGSSAVSSRFFTQRFAIDTSLESTFVGSFRPRCAPHVDKAINNGVAGKGLPALRIMQ